jgi:hypothetical protein
MAKHYKSFKLTPYLCTLRVYIDREAFEKAFDVDASGCSACTFRAETCYAVYIPATSDGAVSIRSAAHEAYHITDFIIEDKGMVYVRESDNEHVAYLVGHIAECIAKGAHSLRKQDAAA